MIVQGVVKPAPRLDFASKPNVRLRVMNDKTQSEHNRSASLIGRLGSSALRLSTNSSVDVAHGLSLLFGLGTKGPSIMGFEDKVEQSLARPCRRGNGRFK